jgi:hypothetical protein
MKPGTFTSRVRRLMEKRLPMSGKSADLAPLIISGPVLSAYVVSVTVSDSY